MSFAVSPNGAKSIVQHYARQVAEGTDTGCFPTGEVSYRAFYKAGKQVGVWTWYEKDWSIRTEQDHGGKPLHSGMTPSVLYEQSADWFDFVGAFAVNRQVLASLVAALQVSRPSLNWLRPAAINRNQLPGDEIEIVDENVILNGAEWNDPHGFRDLESPACPDLTNFGPIQIPLDSFLVLGDKRRRSRDSRILGTIPFSDLQGKACMIYWSRERRFPEPWDRSNYQAGPIAWSRICVRLDQPHP